MEPQQRRFSCGPSAVRAALYVLGHTISESSLRHWAGTTPEGTDERGVMRAIHHYGHKTREYQEESIKVSWNWLKTTLSRGRPVLLCVDDWDHWVAAVGRFGGKVMIFDPARERGRKMYSGLRFYSEQELASRWRYTDKTTGKSSDYAIAITL